MVLVGASVIVQPSKTRGPSTEPLTWDANRQSGVYVWSQPFDQTRRWCVTANRSIDVNGRIIHPKEKARARLASSIFGQGPLRGLCPPQSRRPLQGPPTV